MTAPVFQAIGTAVGSAVGATYVWPAHQADDIGILSIESLNGESVGAISGWSEVTNSPFGNAGTSPHQVQYYWYRATSSAEADVVIPDIGDHQIGRITTVRGAITTGDPIDGAPATGSEVVGASGTATFPDLTPSVNDCLIMLFIADGNDDAGVSQWSGWTNAAISPVERGEAHTNQGGGGGFTVATGTLAAAGAIGATTVTGAGARTVTYFVFAIKPPAAAGHPTIRRLALGKHNARMSRNPYVKVM